YPVGAVGPIDSKGQNAFSDDTCDDPDSNNDVHETDLKLGPLQYNGGPPGMLTQVPDIDSPLVDRIDPVTYVVDPDIGNKDIRGRPRQADGNGNGLYYFDIGSVERDDSQPEFVSIPAAPGPINLGSVAINTTITKTNALRIFNAGDAPLVLSNVGLGGSFPAEFAVVGAFPTTITAASSVTVAMTCRPTVAAARSATLNMNTNDPNLPSRSFNLSCGGLAAAVNAGFGSTPESPGLLSAETTAGKPVVMTITVRETGNATLSLGAGTLTSSPAGAFGGLTGLSTTIVDGGADKLVTVQCLATSVGLKSATLSFSTNDPSRPTANYTFTCNVLKGKDDLFGSTYSNSSAPINGPYGVAVSPDAQHVYVADSGGSGVTLYDVLGGNSLSYQATYASASLSVSRRFTSPEQVAVSPDGANVYVTGVTGDSIAVYARDQSSGDLTHMETVRNGSSYGCVNTLQVNQPSAGPICSSLSGMDGAYGIAFSPGGEHVYVTTKYSSTVMVFGRQTSGAETGSLEYPSPSILRTAFLQRYTNTLLSAAYGVAVSPDGANVYVTGYTSDALITLDRDASNGRLTTRQVLTSSAASGLNGVFRVTISADGKHVYTAAYDSDSVCAFTRSQVNGALTPIACYTSAELNAASDVALSPDGRMLFATGYSGNSLTAFERDMDTGGLTFRDVITKGISGFPRIAGARGVVINPNGQAAYVTGYTDDATVAIIFNAPSPVATGLAPLSVAQGYASPLPVTVSGVDFQANSVVRVGGANRATTYKSKTELAATLLASDFSAAGERQITVNTPTPGGGTSNVLTFTVLAPGAIPVPAVALLSPQSVLAGSGAQTIEVRGTGFIASAVVLFNNAARATTWLSSTLIRGALLAGDVAQAGTALISVDNSPSLLLPEVAGTTSNALALEITAPELPPAPSISALQPAAAAARGPAAQVPITITGLNFSLNSQALWNDDPRPTQYVSPTRLIATISAADLILEGSAGVSVNTPGPGGGDSNVLGFTITPPPSYVYLPLVRR
ncbi:MAG TPA: beta-propeller fold lactonase family protein, partial [Thermoflexales bacterium]|nr:beta-propeller fold lactonase family protein [Thermoflexales bacterium]HQZ53572.1 beta-propeller fold lactonase family protein [Thermoflexales bacterium]